MDSLICLNKRISFCIFYTFFFNLTVYFEIRIEPVTFCSPVFQSSPTRELRSQANIPGCLSSEAVKRKGDFVFQTGHVIEIVTKLFLVVQNATGKPPAINIATEFETNFGTHNVTFQFKVIFCCTVLEMYSSELLFVCYLHS